MVHAVACAPVGAPFARVTEAGDDGTGRDDHERRGGRLDVQAEDLDEHEHSQHRAAAAERPEAQTDAEAEQDGGERHGVRGPERRTGSIAGIASLA